MDTAAAFKLLDEYIEAGKSNLVGKLAIQAHIVQKLWDAGYCIRIIEDKEQLCHRSSLESVARE